jgi:hypothetical protein
MIERGSVRAKKESRPDIQHGFLTWNHADRGSSEF